MKTFISMLIVCLFSIITGCKSCVADYQERTNGVKKICPTCTFVMSEGQYIAVDTAKRPNIIYKVYFKHGGIWYKASDVDHLVRIN